MISVVTNVLPSGKVMKVLLTTPRVDAFGAYSDGNVIDVPEAEAHRMIEAGQAVPVRGPRVETAAVRPAENMAARVKPRK